MKYKTIDLCAGIGGIRRGFEMTGRFENVLSAEIDKYAAMTYEHLYGEKPFSDLTSEEFKKEAERTPFDVLLAGFPCQTFSSAGLKKGFEDETKGTIFFHIADIISSTRPKAVFLENVENLLIHDKGNTIKTILDTFDQLDYKVVGAQKNIDGQYINLRESFLRNSKNFGVPQNRPRVYIMAFDKTYYGENAIKSLNGCLPENNNGLEIFKDLSEIIDENVPRKYYLSANYWDTLKKHKSNQKTKGNGFGYCIVNDENRKSRVANTIMATGGSGKERNLIRNMNAPYAGEKDPSKRSVINSEGIRTMTPTEWGRLQGFIGYGFLEDGKETFSFPAGVSDAQKYKQFGNSVSIPVVKQMADYMLERFDDLNKDKAGIVLTLAKKEGYISRKDVTERLKISDQQASYLLRKLVSEDKLVLEGNKKGARYKIK